MGLYAGKRDIEAGPLVFTGRPERTGFYMASHIGFRPIWDAEVFTGGI